MNGKLSDSDLREAVTRCVSSLEVPRFDLPAIVARKASSAASVPRAPIALPRRVLIAVPLAIVLVAVLVNMPSVIAQVERALHAFAIVNGQTVPLIVRKVTLDEARRQMPFEVIPPAGVPAGLRLTISALSSQSSSNDARLIFEYRSNGELPVLTIEESSARNSGPTKLMLSESRTIGGHAPKAPDVAPPADEAGQPGLGPAARTADKEKYVMRNVEIKRINGHTVKTMYEIRPTAWITHGTHIVLAAPLGALTGSQIAAIRAAMSR